MHISKIKINNFRNFSNLEVNLHEGLNVIVGPNNVGKSNFIKTINFLGVDPNSQSSVDDFNKYYLHENIDTLKIEPPNIEIEYTFEHDIDFNEEDSAFSKLASILIVDPLTGNIESNEENKAHLVAKTRLVYSYDVKEKETYLDEMSSVSDFKGLYKVLQKLENGFKWNFYNITTGEIIDRKIINNLFEIDEISATRTVDRITEHSQKYVNQKIKDKNINTFDIKQDITTTIRTKLESVKTEINNDINEDQNQIGITNGKNKFVSNFVFDGELSSFFTYELEDDKLGFSLPLNYNGLGYNNLIYMRNLLKQKRNNDYNIILLEEPEAHLHPNMQYKLLAYIENLKSQRLDDADIKNQIIVTTHSSNITANLPLENIIIFSIDRANNMPINNAINLCENFEYEKIKLLYEHPENNQNTRTALLEQSKLHLIKFLDVTRSDILFSEKIILVEGLAEKLLIPKYFNNLVEEHVSIVELGGVNFNYFLPLAFNTYKKILCITDRDVDIITEEMDGLKLDFDNYNSENSRINEMFSHFPNQIKVFTQKRYGSTFEKELFIENYDNNFQLLMSIAIEYESFAELIKHKDINYWYENYINFITNGNQKKFLNEKLTKYKKLYDEDANNKNLIEMLFFTDIFYHYIKNRKGDFALKLFEHKEDVIIPKYIKDGVEWLNL